MDFSGRLDDLIQQFCTLKSLRKFCQVQAVFCSLAINAVTPTAGRLFKKQFTFFQETLGLQFADEVTPEHIQALINGFLQRNLSNVTLFRSVGAFQRAYNWMTQYSSDYEGILRDSAKNPGTVLRDRGNVDALFNRAGKIFEREYYVPYMIHTPMEPPAAVADFKNGKCEIWACTQHPIWVRDTAAEVLGIEKENIKVHVTLLGAGFGRKSKADFGVEENKAET